MAETLTLDLLQEPEDALPGIERQEGLQGKDEMNLAEFPFAVLTRYVPAGQKTIEVVQEGRNSAGKPIRQEWIVTGSDAFGLPTAADEEVYVALMKLLRDSGFRSKTVQFRIVDLHAVRRTYFRYTRTGAGAVCDGSTGPPPGRAIPLGGWPVWIQNFRCTSGFGIGQYPAANLPGWCEFCVAHGGLA